jgi:hypothetical protein
VSGLRIFAFGRLGHHRVIVPRVQMDVLRTEDTLADKHMHKHMHKHKHKHLRLRLRLLDLPLGAPFAHLLFCLRLLVSTVSVRTKATITPSSPSAFFR